MAKIMNNRLTHLRAVVSILVLFAFAPLTTQGQVIGQPYRLTDKEVEKIIERIEKQSDKFRSSLDAALDRSRLDSTNREDDINAFVKEFYQSTKRLRDRFDDRKSTSPDVQGVLDRAARIEGFMRRYRLSSRAQQDWTVLKSYLDDLAQAYKVTWRWGVYEGVGGYPPVGTVVSNVPYRVSDKEVERIINRIEKQSDKFRSRLDTALDKSRFDGSREEDNINAFVSGFYEATKRLHDHFNNRKSTEADVQSVLDRASQVDNFMRRHIQLIRRAQGDWTKLKSDLDALATVYGVRWHW
jgi:signal transduction histidine kinase